MRIYRANGFVVLEDVGSYLVNQLVANKNGNNIHIRQIGVSKKEVIVRALGIGVGLLTTINYAEMSFD